MDDELPLVGAAPPPKRLPDGAEVPLVGCEPAPKPKVAGAGVELLPPPPNWNGAAPDVLEAAPNSNDGACEPPPLENGLLNESFPPPALKVKEPVDVAGAALLPPNEKEVPWVVLAGSFFAELNKLLVGAWVVCEPNKPPPVEAELLF